MKSAHIDFAQVCATLKTDIASVVPWKEGDVILPMDFTKENPELTSDVINDTELFSRYVRNTLQQQGARYGIGGYNEHRTIYSRSTVFDSAQGKPRRLHLGTDIWGPAGTPVFAPLEATVHSVGLNRERGDYGGTIVLKHQHSGIEFHTLYGHLSHASIDNKHEGTVIARGQQIGAFGPPPENGDWPPHLHFQIVLNMQDWQGDYPGVCIFEERDHWLTNSPDPALLLVWKEQPDR